MRVRADATSGSDNRKYGLYRGDRVVHLAISGRGGHHGEMGI